MKMQRHLVSVHKDEREVAKIMSLQDQAEKKLEFARLRNRRNFNHNANVLERGEGSLICSRKIKRTVSPRKHLPCTNCLGMFLSKDLYVHSRRCQLRSGGGVDKKRKHIKARARALLHGAVGENQIRVSRKFRADVLDNTRVDKLSKFCQNDELIVQFGMSLHEKLGRRRRNDISQRLRQLARLMAKVNAKQAPSRVSLMESLTVKMFHDVVCATQSLCESFDDPSGRPLMKNPSIGLKLGQPGVMRRSQKRDVTAKR